MDGGSGMLNSDDQNAERNLLLQVCKPQVGWVLAHQVYEHKLLVQAEPPLNSVVLAAFSQPCQISFTDEYMQLPDRTHRSQIQFLGADQQPVLGWITVDNAPIGVAAEGAELPKPRPAQERGERCWQCRALHFAPRIVIGTIG